MRYIGVLMVLEGFLLAFRRISGSALALLLGWFLTSSGFWSQMRAGLPYWLPITNLVLGWVVWSLQNNDMTNP
ncbi:hypothetical protein CMUS01_01270 [Colletotrichum musicola]|uniref:Uncharacterized protein n=1 Tax=Colletotrichum musicola TaxID=2175873 RepID=A0A8H6U8U2_9PEZI|nr:hypothetical protein CMUS01_01270 [Colletotrichum musicola]